MLTIAQTYLHFRVDPSPKTVEMARRYFEYLAAVSASEHFKSEVQVDVRVEEGSLKGWLTVAGGIYAGICAYGSFREGVDYLVKDSKDFSEYIIKRTLTEAHPPSDSIVRTERRLGVPGQLQRLNQLVEEASEAVRAGDQVRARMLLEKVQRYLDRVQHELINEAESATLNQLMDSIPRPILDRLPGPTPPHTGGAYAAGVSLLDKDRPKRLMSPSQLGAQFRAPPPPPVLSAGEA